MIKENCLVRSLAARAGFPAGTLGVVVSLYSSGPACQVEVWDESGYPAGTVTHLLGEATPADCHNGQAATGTDCGKFSESHEQQL